MAGCKFTTDLTSHAEPSYAELTMDLLYFAIQFAFFYYFQ